MRLAQTIILALVIILSFSGMAAAQDGYSILIDGVDITATMDVQPQNIAGRILVPARYVAENLGATVTWDAQNRNVLINSSPEDAQAKNTIHDGLQLIIDNADITPRMDVPPLIIAGRTMVPARYVAEALGANVEWQEETRRVVITSASTNHSNTVMNNTPALNEQPEPNYDHNLPAKDQEEDEQEEPLYPQPQNPVDHTSNTDWPIVYEGYEMIPQQTKTFRPLAEATVFLADLAQGGDLEVEFGLISAGPTWHSDSYINISGAGGNIQLMQNAYARQEGYQQSQYWSAKVFAEGAVVKDQTGPLTVVFLYALEDGSIYLTGDLYESLEAYSASAHAYYSNLTPPFACGFICE